MVFMHYPDVRATHKNQMNITLFVAERISLSFPRRQTCVGVRPGDFAFSVHAVNVTLLQKTTANVSSDAFSTPGGRQTCVGVGFKLSSRFARYRLLKNANKRKPREPLGCLRARSVRQRSVCGAVPGVSESSCGSTLAKCCAQTGFAKKRSL